MNFACRGVSLSIALRDQRADPGAAHRLDGGTPARRGAGRRGGERGASAPEHRAVGAPLHRRVRGRLLRRPTRRRRRHDVAGDQQTAHEQRRILQLPPAQPGARGGRGSGQAGLDRSTPGPASSRTLARDRSRHHPGATRSRPLREPDRAARLLRSSRRPSVHSPRSVIAPVIASCRDPE